MQSVLALHGYYIASGDVK